MLVVPKGGVGKTTLAFNFAVALSRTGRDVLLVDSDTQATAMINTQIRTGEQGSPGYTAVALYGQDLVIQVPQLAKKYDDVIVDVGGRDNPSLRSALLIPNSTVLVPVKTQELRAMGSRRYLNRNQRGSRQGQHVTSCRRRHQ